MITACNAMCKPQKQYSTTLQVHVCVGSGKGLLVCIYFQYMHAAAFSNLNRDTRLDTTASEPAAQFQVINCFCCNVAIAS